MIRINLLGKKKLAAVPFGLDEKLAKLGVNVDELQDLRPAAARVLFVAVGLYVANFVPTYLHEEKVRQLDAQFSQLSAKTSELQKELAAKKDIRKQKDQLDREEAELNRQLNAVESLKRGRSLAFGTLNDVVMQMLKSDKVWLEDIRYENHKITLTGRSWEYFAVNDFVKAVTESTRYSNVLFKEISAEPPKNKPIPGVPEALQKTKRFSLEFNVREEG
jgi:Tfp pilus assembly protein PilN